MSSPYDGPADPRPGPPAGPTGPPSTGRDDTAPMSPFGSPPQPGQGQSAQGQPPQPPASSWPAGPAPAPRRRRGPGWAAVMTIAFVAALIAGLLGGVAGALVAGGGDTAAPEERSAPPQVDRPEGSIAGIAADAVPSVVTIRVRGAGGGGGTGTGWVYDDDGHIVTNNHVVDAAEAGGATVTVETDDGQRHEAELVGRDVSYDLAVLRSDDVDAPPLPVGRSADVVVGDEVVAVGSPLGLSSSVTSGIVSALERPVSAGDAGQESYISAIQTDAAINPGNSGGPLISSSGEVVGVNSAIAQIPGQQSASGSIGVGFAIPSDVVARTADQLIEDGTAEHPAIGVSLDTRATDEGARVLDDDDAPDGRAVVQGGPADKAGVEAGDVIVEMDGRRITAPDQLIVRIRAKAVGDTVTLTVRRGQEQEDLTMTLEPAPES